MEPFKNLLGFEAAQKIARAVKNSSKSFDEKLFLKELEQDLDPLELKERMMLLSERLNLQLPENREQAFDILLGTLRKDENDTTGLGGFLVWPLTQIVADTGLQHFDVSMATLKEMTKVFTGEFAIRPFFIHDEERTLKQFAKWTTDKNHHVRRFVSEGSRPLLPWGLKLPSFAKNPEKTWFLLEELKTDSSDYVRKSVANHINDHSKAHPEYVVKQLGTWVENPHPHMQWIVRHATRTLIKKGHQGALKLSGVEAGKAEVTAMKIHNPEIKVGEALQVRVEVHNPTKKLLKIVLDHEIGFLKANGKPSPKVFKGRNFELGAGKKQKLELVIPIKRVSTRKYYPGKHTWAVKVNGKVSAKKTFLLKK